MGQTVPDIRSVESAWTGASIRRLWGRMGGRQRTHWLSNMVCGIGIPYRPKSKAHSPSSNRILFFRN